MGTLGGFAAPFGPPPAAVSPLASPCGDFGTCTFPTTPARYARALALGLANPPAMVRRRRGRARGARGGQGGLSVPKGRRAPHAARWHLVGAPLQAAWLAWLGLGLATQGAHAADVDERTAAPYARAPLQPGAAQAPLQPAAGPATGAGPGPATDGNARPAPSVAETAALTTDRDRFRGRHGRHRQRTGVDPRLADLAATRGKVAAVAHLHGAAPIKPARPTAAAAEHRIRVHQPDKPPEPARPAPPAVEGPITALDESIVKEITQRKILFRMCYESARRRGVTATRADVKWVLAADGGVHDVEVAVAQDAQLANCIRVVASRPFAAGVGQDMPVAIPLLFVSAR
jgi:hypothetical protein